MPVSPSPSPAVAAHPPAGGVRAVASRPARWRGLLRLGVSAGLLAWVLGRGEVAAVLAVLRAADLRVVAALVLTFPLTYLYVARRWGLLLRAQGHPLPFALLLRSCAVAIFAKQLLPSTLGGDAVRLWDSWRAGVGRGTAVATLVVDRLVGVLPLLLFAVAGLVGARELVAGAPSLPFWLAAAMAAAAGAVLVVFLPARLRRRLAAGGAALPRGVASLVARLTGSFAGLAGAHGVLARAFAWSVLLQVHIVLFYWAIGRALDLPLPLLRCLLVVPIALVCMMLPVTINGIGLREGVFVVLLGWSGIAPAQAVAFAWLEYGILLLWGIVGGAVHIAGRRAGGAAEAVPAGSWVTGPG